ncbi:palmitoyltransferase PFA5 [Pseudomassariella vexata]|uniref:Palmitoyltransferase n=1 Tax=Pseudomassariella vexata TaxID=1141098 RepID=A0A1Y2DNA2_9PEZI|nr:palmitoyltransferase PFA5 [Pseudomassariella vexata]ORY60634.1 palmitoyltransferase PFA5 [Pseudomassariella vexata]
MPTESVRASSRWVTRSIPVILASAVGYATFVVVARVCVKFLINSRGDVGAATAILVFYFLLLLLMIATYVRTITIINTDPGLVPLGPLAIERRKKEKRSPKTPSREGDIEGQPYYVSPDPNPDSPGLEQFYTKDVFVCENDGRPKWCSDCCNWKSDRAHHSSEINRCVTRMDHYCPWVGGMVGENSFKFFTQFTMYTACYCGVVLGAAGSSLQKQIRAGEPFDSHFIGVLGLAGFFGLFTLSMTLASWRYISINMTNVDMFGAKSKVYQLAVRVPLGTPSTDTYNTVTYPLPRPESSTKMLGFLTAAMGSLSERPHSDSSNGHEQAKDQGDASTENGDTGINGSSEHPKEPQNARDALAQRTYAILRTDPGENPWDLGFWQNWKDVMGNNILDWFLPLRRSPCTCHDSQESYYRMGPLLSELRARYGIGEMPRDEANWIQMSETTR